MYVDFSVWNKSSLNLLSDKINFNECFTVEYGNTDFVIFQAKPSAPLFIVNYSVLNVESVAKKIKKLQAYAAERDCWNR